MLVYNKLIFSKIIIRKYSHYFNELMSPFLLTKKNKKIKRELRNQLENLQNFLTRKLINIHRSVKALWN